MGADSATKDVQVNVGKDLSTAIIQGVKVEVSPDGNVVVYTNDGVQTKPAADDGALPTRKQGNDLMCRGEKLVAVVAGVA